MSMSQWDQQLLTPEQNQLIAAKQAEWGSNPAQRDSLHAFVEGERAKAGYSGGVDGSQYIPIEGFKPPTAPVIGDFNSSMSGEWAGIIDKMKNPEPAPDYYMNLMNQQLSDIMNRPKFEYNADEDPAYQAFLQRAGKAGDKAYADNLGGMSAMTGGRPNSWAGTVASQARNAYTLQAQEAVIQFEDRAYSRYQGETQDMYNLLGALGAADDREYSRYRDGIQDNKDFADMIFKLEDREFEQFKFKTDNEWKKFDTEYTAYNDAISFKNDQIKKAIDRSNMLGYVNNQDSIALGVPAGTLSQTARERAEDMIDYIKKQELDLGQFRKEMEIRHEFDLKLIKAKPSGGSGGGGGSISGDDGTPQLTAKEVTTKNKELDKFDKLVSSQEYKDADSEKDIKDNQIAESQREVRYNMIDQFIDNIETQYIRGAYGDPKNVGYKVFTSILNDISNTSSYQKDYRIINIINNEDTGLDF